uniref:Uncharacterized protein n=1 Tax=Caenorhabditis japonica TaxID=281687 RepID=A0A8R1INY2_CAEJA
MRHRKLLEMSEAELRAVTAIVLPGRKGDELKIGEMQEMCIKWLFSNGLSLNHIFELHDEDGQVFCVMRNSESCVCCPKASDTGTLTEFDRGPIGDNYSRTPSPIPRSIDNKLVPPPRVKPKPSLLPTSKIAPITVQPTIVTIPDEKGEEKKEKEETSTCGYCKRECGLCIVNLCTQF